MNIQQSNSENEMKEIIKRLHQLRVDITAQMHGNCFPAPYSDGSTKYEHRSPEQTRDILFRSMFAQSVTGINTSIAQLEILEKELY